MSDPVQALRRQLQQLETRHRKGRIDQATFDRERAAIERALVDQVMTSAGTADPAAAHAAGRPSRPLVAGLVAAVLVLAIGGYAVTGSPQLVSGVPTAPAEPAPITDPAQFAAVVEQLAQKLKEQPNNLEGWVMLGRSYMQLERPADAVQAYAKAVALKGDDAQILTDYADALATAQGRKLDGEPQALLDRALALEPDNLKALALAGSAAYGRQDFATALRHWERLQGLAPADSPFMEALRGSIAQARQHAGLPPAAAAPAAAATTATTTVTPTATSASASAAASNVALRGQVRLAPALAAQAAPGDTVFIFARPAEGSRMPLAVLRKQVRDLPLAFSLDDSLAMSPAARLSAHPKVLLEARISKSGQAQPAAGDLVARSGPLAHDAQGVELEINDVVK